MTIKKKRMKGNASEKSSMQNTMSVMEHPMNTLAVPPLVDERVLLQFCQAVQRYADSEGMHDEAAKKLHMLQSTLANLQHLAILCRLAILGHPFSFARVVDELFCISADFPCDRLRGQEDDDGEFCEDEPDDRVQLTAAVDLFVGATFVSKDDVCQCDRFISALVQAIEDAIAFPVTYAVEAANYLGQGTGGPTPTHDAIVIGNATQRLLESHEKCIPRAPIEIRRRLEGLARRWVRTNPVTLFFEVISGPKIRQIVHWEDPSRDRPDDARIGDPVTLFFRSREEDETGLHDDACQGLLYNFEAMFCPHQPARIVRAVKNGVEVFVPERASTGPVAIVKREPNFEPVWKLLWKYAQLYPVEMTSSIFAVGRMDMWAYPFAFRGPIIEIAPTPPVVTLQAFTAAGPLTKKLFAAMGEIVAIHYTVFPPGSTMNVPMSVHAPGGTMTPSEKPGVLFYQPFSPGTNVIELAWGDLKVTMPIKVKPAATQKKGAAV